MIMSNIPMPRTEGDQHDQMVKALEDELITNEPNKAQSQTETIRADSGTDEAGKEPGTKSGTPEVKSGSEPGTERGTEERGALEKEFKSYRESTERKIAGLEKDIEEIMKIKAQGRGKIGESEDADKKETKEFKERWADTGLLRE